MGLAIPDIKSKSLYKMEKSKIDLNAPAFGPGSQKLEDVSEETPKIEPEPVKEVEKEEVVVVVEEKPSDEESEEPKRVTYSRFKNVWSRAEQAEKAAEEARQEANEWRLKAEQRTEPKESVGDVPNWWEKLYGDSNESKEAWSVQNKANTEFQERVTRQAREDAIEAVKNQKSEEETRTNENVKEIDSQLEQLEAFVGRELTQKEQSALLDIVDDYAPKDEDGNYLGALMPFEKAWEVLELKNKVQQAPMKQARDAVASLNGSQTQGDPSLEEERNKSWNPLDWNSYKKRI